MAPPAVGRSGHGHARTCVGAGLVPSAPQEATWRSPGPHRSDAAAPPEAQRVVLPERRPAAQLVLVLDQDEPQLTSRRPRLDAEPEAGDGAPLAELEARIEAVTREEGPDAPQLLALHEDLVDAAEARGDLARAEVAQVRLLELRARRGATYESLPGVAQYRPCPPPEGPLTLEQPRWPLHARPPALPPLERAIAAQGEELWAEAEVHLLQHFQHAPDDPVAHANRVICALHRGHGAEGRHTMRELLDALPHPLVATAELVGLLCSHAAGDHEAGRPAPDHDEPPGRAEIDSLDRVDRVVEALEDLAEHTPGARHALQV